MASRLFESALFIARSDLRHMLRHRETLVWVFVMPFVFFYFIGTVTGRFGSVPGPAPLALKAPANAGVLLDELVRRLEAQQYRIVRVETDEDLRRYARRLIVPDLGGASFTAAVAAGTRVELTFERDGDELAANLDRVRVARAVYGLLADLAVLANENTPPAPEAFGAIAARPRALTLRAESAGRRRFPPTGYAQTIPATLVMFTMLVLLTSGTVTFVIERETGVLRRLAAAPLSPLAVVAGKWMARMALAVVQIAFGVLAGTVIFKMNWGGSLPMVALLLAAWAAFNASASILLANLARSQAQAIAIGLLTTLALAALGGCWWPIEITPTWMQRLALALPTGWAMDAMHKLVNFGYDAASAWPHVASLFGGSIVLGLSGARIFRFS